MNWRTYANEKNAKRFPRKCFEKGGTWIECDEEGKKLECDIHVKNLFRDFRYVVLAQNV